MGQFGVLWSFGEWIALFDLAVEQVFLIKHFYLIASDTQRPSRLKSKDSWLNFERVSLRLQKNSMMRHSIQYSFTTRIMVYRRSVAGFGMNI